MPMSLAMWLMSWALVTLIWFITSWAAKDQMGTLYQEEFRDIDRVDLVHETMPSLGGKLPLVGYLIFTALVAFQFYGHYEEDILAFLFDK